MLIDQSNVIKENDVIAAKLVSGEELITKVVQITDTEFIVSKPLAMTLVPQGNQATVAFVPWTLGMPEDAKIKLQRGQILAYAKARKDAADSYIRQTTGIEVAPANTIIK